MNADRPHCELTRVCTPLAGNGMDLKARVGEGSERLHWSTPPGAGMWRGPIWAGLGPRTLPEPIRRAVLALIQAGGRSQL